MWLRLAVSAADSTTRVGELDVLGGRGSGYSVVGCFVEPAGPPFHVDTAVDLRSASAQTRVGGVVDSHVRAFYTHDNTAGNVSDVSPSALIIADLKRCHRL